MKSSPALDPAAAFPDSMHVPGEGELQQALGSAWPPLEQVLRRLQAAHPEITTAWQFSPRAGWYQVRLLKKRRLLYLVPKQGDFRLSIILGGKAVTRLQTGPFTSRVAKLLKTAKHYPEGTMFDFDRTSLGPDLLTAFLEAKISPEPARN